MNVRSIQVQGIELTELSYHKSQEELIIFRPTIPNQLLCFLQQTSEQIVCRWCRRFFQQTSQFMTKCPLICIQCQIEDRLVEIVENISVFKGKMFYARRYKHQKTNEAYKIYLKPSHIQNINFRNLKWLSMNNCFLDNIQAIAWLDIKNVDYISLQTNFISSLQCFSKIFLTQLLNLDISENLISYSSLSKLQRSHFPKFQMLQMYGAAIQTKNNQMQDMRSHVKLQIDKKRLQAKQYLLIYSNKFHINSRGSKWKKIVNQQLFLKFIEL